MIWTTLHFKPHAVSFVIRKISCLSVVGTTGPGVAICSNCDLVSVNPLPDQSYLNSTYQPANHSPQSKTWEAYFKIAQNTQKELDSKEKIDIKKCGKLKPKNRLKKGIESDLKLIERFSRHKGKLLDLGCGEGHFLNMLSHKAGM